jgi:hypothetical protein
MNLVQSISKEHSRRLTLAIVQWVGVNEKRMCEFMEIILGGDGELARRASWALAHFSEIQIEMLNLYAHKMIKKLYEDGLHDGLKRNILKPLTMLHFSEDDEGLLLDKCFKLFSTVDESEVVKIYAMEIIYTLSQKYEELGDELFALLEYQLPQAKPALKSRAKRLYKNAKRICPI